MTDVVQSVHIVWACKWFEIVAKQPPSFVEPHYSIHTLDYVVVVAVEAPGRFLLVRQLRPATDGFTLELPSGHVEPNEMPEEAARRELLEETGHVADQFELLANLSPDTGRLGNRIWCFFAGNARPANVSQPWGEKGVDCVGFEGSLRALLVEKQFCSALNWGALMAAVSRGRLQF